MALITKGIRYILHNIYETTTFKYPQFNGRFLSQSKLNFRIEVRKNSSNTHLNESLLFVKKTADNLLKTSSTVILFQLLLGQSQYCIFKIPVQYIIFLNLAHKTHHPSANNSWLPTPLNSTSPTHTITHTHKRYDHTPHSSINVLPCQDIEQNAPARWTQGGTVFKMALRQHLLES